jgi:hypothetical protein
VEVLYAARLKPAFGFLTVAWFLGTFPEDDVPEKAYKKLLEGRRERKKKRLLKSQSQEKGRIGGGG